MSLPVPKALARRTTEAMAVPAADVCDANFRPRDYPMPLTQDKVWDVYLPVSCSSQQLNTMAVPSHNTNNFEILMNEESLQALALSRTTKALIMLCRPQGTKLIYMCFCCFWGGVAAGNLG